MRKLESALMLGGLLCVSAAAPAHAGIFNATYKRGDGYFLPNFVSGTAPRVTIMRGFCYDFDLNGDFIDLTEKVTTTSSGITQLSRTHTKNGTQNTVNGHGMGQITVHFCAMGSTGDKTIKVQNFGGGEFDHLTVSVTKGGSWSTFAGSMTPARVNIPFQFTVNGTDLADATIEGIGIRRVTDASDINTDDQLRMTLVFDASVGAQTGNQVLFLRRFSGGTGSAVTDPGMVRNGSGSSGMIMAVTGSAPIVGTPTPIHPGLIGGTAPAPAGPATIDDIKLHAVLGRSLRHVAAFRKIDETFCQGFAVPARGGATERDITVPTWSLSASNSANAAFTTAGSLALVGPQPAPAAVQFQSIDGHASVVIAFTRPTNISRAILILPTTDAATKALYGGAGAIGCYQAVMDPGDPRNWVDPPFDLHLLDTGGRVVLHVAF